MELKQQIEELGKVVTEFKAAHTKELDEMKKSGQASAETKGLVDKLNDKIGALETEISQTKAALNRSSQGGENNTDKKDSEYGKKFNSYMRKGVEFDQKTAWNEEYKDMSVQVDEDGGFLVRPEVSSEIVKKVFESSPLRQLASQQTISTDALEILEDLDEAGSGWVGETQARPTTTTPKLKMISIPVHELYAMPKATQKLLDDAAVNVESWLSGKVSEKFARDEATAFVRGDGVQKPKGILAYGEGDGFGLIERKTTAVQGVFTDLELIDLAYLLKGDYKANAKWLMQRNTAKVLRKFKGSDGQYLWQPGLNGSQPSVFLGHEIMEANDMDAFTGVPGTDASKQVIMFGDFRAGYQIVDRIGIRVLRDPYTAKPYILFYTTKRVGGAVKNFEAIKVLKLAA